MGVNLWICKIFQNIFFYRTPLVAAFVKKKENICKTTCVFTALKMSLLIDKNVELSAVDY